jgi:gliding motility-associated-like protein
MINPIVFLPGQDTVILNLTPVQDGLNEGFESVTIMVSIINPCGDTITSQGTIYIGDGPIINITESDVLVQCFPDSVLLTASASGGYGPYDFVWTTLTGSPVSIVDSFYVTVSQNGVVQYLVTATDQCNFTQTDTATVTVLETISIDNITVVNSSCVPSGSLSVQTSGTNGNVTYSWSTGQTTQSIQNIVSAWYQVTVTDAVCSTTDSAFVDIIAPPVANFSAVPVSGCSPLTVQFTNNSQNGTSYNWNFGNGQTANATTTSNQSMTYTTPDPESYTATLVVSQGQFCSDTFTLVIQVDVCDCNDPEATNYNPLANVNVPSNCIYPYPEISVPNVFTPNEDTNNDDFFLTWKNVTSLNLVIINRWGNVVFEEFSDDLINNNPSWNGDSDGKPVSDGIYFYKFTAIGIGGQELEGHGFIHLLK